MARIRKHAHRTWGSSFKLLVIALFMRHVNIKKSDSITSRRCETQLNRFSKTSARLIRIKNPLSDIVRVQCVTELSGISRNGSWISHEDAPNLPRGPFWLFMCTT